MGEEALVERMRRRGGLVNTPTRALTGRPTGSPPLPAHSASRCACTRHDPQRSTGPGTRRPCGPSPTRNETQPRRRRARS